VTALFRLESVELARGGRPVLRGVDVELPPGSACIWGPSGSGKTTLLRLLNRLADPDRGCVRFHGDDVRACDPIELRRRVALVPQLPALVAGTVAANVLYGPGLAGRDADVDRLLPLVDLDPVVAGQEAGQLSVGQQQRVMLARALALEPEVLLLDEPTSALDAGSRAAVEATLLQLRDSLGLSLVVVTHDRRQAGRLADWIVELEDGRAKRCGPATELLAVS
jgi:ABC-type proline/glycine betaine transport system ATPase subunit